MTELTAAAEPSELSANRLLAALTAEQLRRFRRRGETVELRFGATLHEKGARVAEVYFPTSGVVSLFAVEDQAMLEVAMTGAEGVIGSSALSGVFVSPQSAVVQGAGKAFKVLVADFVRESERNKSFARALNRYAHYLNVQISQNVLCNSLHRAEARLACLLLLMRDRVKSEEFRLKQEFLASMLGVRREAVTRAASSLQQQNLIQYSRGILRILNRAALQTVCCRCYEIVSEEYRSLIAAS